jgi:hypothetical protein
MEYSACAAECNLSLLTGTPPTPRHLRILPLFQLAQTEPTIIQPAPALRNVLAAPHAGELLSVFSSLCADPFDAAEVRSSLWHLFYVSERFELEQLRQFKQVFPLLRCSVCSNRCDIPGICSVLRLRLVTGRLRVGCRVAVAAWRR